MCIEMIAKNITPVVALRFAGADAVVKSTLSIPASAPRAHFDI
jgi:hypothetical protein